MRDVGATAAAVAGGEFSHFVAHGDADGASGHVHMFDRARSVSRSRPQDGGWRNLIAREVDAAGACGSQTCPASGVFTAGSLAAA